MTPSLGEIRLELVEPDLAIRIVGQRCREVAGGHVQVAGDMQPIYYLIEKFLGDPGANEDSLREQALQTLASLPDLIAAAGLAKKGGRR